MERARRNKFEFHHNDLKKCDRVTNPLGLRAHHHCANAAFSSSTTCSKFVTIPHRSKSPMAIGFLLMAAILSFNSQPATCDIFSSSSHLTNLMFLERHMILSLGDFVYNMEYKLQEIKNYIEEFTRTAGRPELQGTFSVDDIIGNPLQAFQLIKRLTINWKYINQLMNVNDWDAVKKFNEEYKELMPDEEDLHGAALAIIRLQDTYNLNGTELVRGIVQDYKARVEMTARDCLYMGKHAFNNGYYGHSIEWLELAMSRAEEEGNTTATVDEIYPFYKMAIEITEEMKPQHSIEGESATWVSVNGREIKFRMLDGDNDDYKRYQALCRGEVLRDPKNETHLKCFYDDRGHPYLKLMPVKVEVMNQDPYIAKFHQLMSDNEIETIKNMAAPLLTRARVQTENGTGDVVSKTRTSQTAWFSPDSHPLVQKINRRIEAVTGLSTDMEKSHSELMQVANYGMGGHYVPHYDYLIVDRPPEERREPFIEDREVYAGDRTATLMFYLSDVRKGGSTVFPRFGVRLVPEKGSAAFWYNLKRNGEGIEDTVHGACPVLLGEKWVANHWIREVGQAFRRPCSLDPDE